MYKDITTYSRNDVKREIRVLENEANGIKFRVHKHIDYGNEWLLSCYELNISNVPLKEGYRNPIGFRQWVVHSII